MKGKLFKYQMTKPCKFCGKLYNDSTYGSHSDWEKSMYCSCQCFHDDPNSNAIRKHSEVSLQKMRDKQLGKIVSEESRKNMSLAQRNSELGKKYRFKSGVENPSYGRNQTGSNNANWRGGNLAPNQIIRNSPKYDEFRLACLRRDYFKCTVCGATGYLHVHHIKELSLFPELAYDINNGKTVCENCHEKIHGRPIRIKRKYINIQLISY